MGKAGVEGFAIAVMSERDGYLHSATAPRFVLERVLARR